MKFFQKRKEYDEYNSQKNTSFFLLTPLGVGLFYNLWGYFTGLGGENLFRTLLPILYISLWTLIFAFPYLLYGLYTIRACYTKFHVVYLIRTRSLSARKFGIFYTLLLLFGILFYIVFFNIILNYFFIVVEQVYFYFDIMLVVIFLTLIYIFIRHGIFGSARSMPEISQDYITRRRQRLRRMTTSPVRTAPSRARTTRTTSRPTPSIPRTTRTTSRPTPSRPRTTRTTSRPVSSRPKTTQTTSRPVSSRPKTTQTTAHKPKTTASAAFEKFKPKAGILSLEDFKCIFCFQLPKLPADSHRGIVLCPNCKHPAHADEFKEWTHDSPLCSRCDAPIPPSFRRNPVIISVKQYNEVINEYKRRKR